MKIFLTTSILVLCGYLIYPSINWYFLMTETERQQWNKSPKQLSKQKETYYKKIEQLRQLIPYKQQRIKGKSEDLFNIRPGQQVLLNKAIIEDLSNKLFGNKEAGDLENRKKLKLLINQALDLEQQLKKHRQFKLLRNRIIKLGLDLAGGTHLTVSVDKLDLIERIQKKYAIFGLKDENNKQELVKGLLDADKIRIDKKIHTKYLKETDQLKDIDPSEKPQKITELGNELQTTYMKVIKEEMETVTMITLTMIRNRVDKFGVTEPKITKGLGDTIFIELPELSKGNIDNTIETITEAGVMNFQLVDENVMRRIPYTVLNKQGDYRGYIAPEQIQVLDSSGEIRYQFLNESLESQLKNKGITLDSTDLEGSSLYPVEASDEFGTARIEGYIILKNKIEVEGEDLIDASIGYNERGIPEVLFELNQTGGNKLRKTSRENLQKRLAIVLDNKVKSAPTITGELGNRGRITWGNAQIEQVNKLVTILKVGILPAKLDLVSAMTIGPSLGKENIAAGLKALAIGLSLVVLFMIIYYKLGGFLAVIGLFLNLFILFSVLSAFGFTLTLPGLAGILLTIGMVVDANVIIFERMKEEMRGSLKSRDWVIGAGYQKALSAILDSNFTTILAAFILSQIGTGIIKGFGFTLMWGIISSLLTSIFITRLLFELSGRILKLKKVYL